ncbi:ankyrin repeat-containing domain protein [Aspergillus insuetus]
MAWTLSTLPPEILLEICDCLEAIDLARLVQTSQSFAGLGVPVLYDGLFSESIHRKNLLAEMKSPYAVNYFATRSEKLLSLPGGKNDRTILYYIVASGNTLLLDTLINQGADVSAKCNRINRPLHVALTKGQEEIVCRLLDVGVDVLPPTLRIPLLAYTHEIISRATIERLISAIEAAGGDAHAPARNRVTPLHHASRMGRETLVSTLLDHGADVLATDNFGHVPLINALFRDKLKVAGILLDAMSRDPRHYDFNAPLPSLQHLRSWIAAGDYEAGDTLLHCAVCTGRARLVQILLDHVGADVDPLVLNHRDTGEERCTPFDLAVEGRCAEIVKLIAEMENRPAFWPSNGAVQRGFQNWIRDAYPGMVRILVNLYKQRKIALDISAATPSVLYACRWYESFQPAASVNESVMPVLSLREIDINAHDTAGDSKTALHLLCSASGLNHKDKKLELAHFFLDHGADWTTRDDVGDTVLHRAAAVPDFHGIVRRIIESAADTPVQKDIISSGNNSGLTPLHSFGHAADFAILEHRAVAKLLIDAGCDPNARAKNGESVAHWAMSPQVTADSLRYLASLGVDLSRADEEGNPPMHSLATRFSSRIKPEVRVGAIRYLADQGADLHPGCRACEGWVMRACSGTQHFDMCGR